MSCISAAYSSSSSAASGMPSSRPMATASLLTRAECPASTYPPISVDRASARTVCR